MNRWMNMKEMQIIRLRNRIENEIASLQNKMKNNFPDPISGRERIPDENDLASELIERDLHIALKGRDRSRLKSLNDAIERIEKGTYGICERCGRTIPEKRLELNPVASCC
jgi:DnaK suppressor protein